MKVDGDGNKVCGAGGDGCDFCLLSPCRSLNPLEVKIIVRLSVHLMRAHGPDLMLKLTMWRGPDRRSSWAGLW